MIFKQMMDKQLDKYMERRKIRNKNNAELSMRLMKILNVILVTSIMSIGWVGVYSKLFTDLFYRKMNLIIMFIFMLLYVVFCRAYDGFKVSLIRIREIVGSQIIAIVLVDSLMFFLACLLAKAYLPIMPMLYVFTIQIVVALVWAIIANKLYFYFYKATKTAVMYRDNRDYEYLERISTIKGRFDVQKWICVRDKIEEYLGELEGIEVVFVRGLPANERNTVLKYCIEKNIEVYQYPKIGDIIMSGAENIQIFHIPVMRVFRYNPAIEFLILKRAMDVLVSVVGIIVLSPVFLVTALLIRCYDGGSILYKQTRLTKDGKEFVIYKFRSMSMDAEKDGVARLASEKDSRITPIGKVIRSTRIDEIPQLFNVLKGEMALVGPRPERPEIAEQYMKELPEFSLRLQAKAGITGYAQIYGKYNTSPYDKLQMDLLYIANPSIVQDIKLLLATVKVLFMKESTEGIAQGQITPDKPYNGVE